MKILTLICAAFLSLSTLSIPVAQEEIDRLNTIISFTDTPSLKVRLTAAERDESTNRLSSIDTETTLTNEEGLSLNVLLGLEKINQEQVQIRGGLKGQVSRAPLTKTQLYVMLTMISSLTEQLNKSLEFEANFNHTSRIASTLMTFLIRSTSEEFDILDEVTIDAVIPKSSGVINGSISGTLNYKKELINLVTELIKAANNAA